MAARIALPVLCLLIAQSAPAATPAQCDMAARIVANPYANPAQVAFASEVLRTGCIPTGDDAACANIRNTMRQFKDDRFVQRDGAGQLMRRGCAP